MSRYDNHIESTATDVGETKPHLYYHRGYWRVSAKHKAACRNPNLGKLWDKAYDWVISTHRVRARSIYFYRED